jgi:hypothetical protein
MKSGAGIRFAKALPKTPMPASTLGPNRIATQLTVLARPLGDPATRLRCTDAHRHRRERSDDRERYPFAYSLKRGFSPSL